MPAVLQKFVAAPTALHFSATGPIFANIWPQKSIFLKMFRWSENRSRSLVWASGTSRISFLMLLDVFWSFYMVRSTLLVFRPPRASDARAGPKISTCSVCHAFALDLQFLCSKENIWFITASSFVYFESKGHENLIFSSCMLICQKTKKRGIV